MKPWTWYFIVTLTGNQTFLRDAENARRENADWKMRYKPAGVENARLENVAQKCIFCQPPPLLRFAIELLFNKSTTNRSNGVWVYWGVKPLTTTGWSVLYHVIKASATKNGIAFCSCIINVFSLRNRYTVWVLNVYWLDFNQDNGPDKLLMLHFALFLYSKGIIKTNYIKQSTSWQVTVGYTQLNRKSFVSGSHHYRRTDQYFLGGLSHLCPKKYLDSPRKNCYANLQNYFAWLTPPDIVISKNPRCRHFISLNGMNSVLFV